MNMAKQMMGDGFSDGSHGRGSNPFKMSHTKKPRGYSPRHFMGNSGRGKAAGTGIHTAMDTEHPQSHAAFEQLGVHGSDGDE